GAGLLCYYVTLRGGRPIAEKLVGDKILKPIDNLITKYGTWFIFIARAVPMMAFDPISYVAGLLKINVKKYTIATFVGSIPRAIFYAVLGSLMLPNAAIGWDPTQWVAFIEGPEFTGFSNSFNLIFIIIMVVLVGMFLVYNFILNPILLKRAAKVQTQEGTANDETGKQV
nr:VTT domain-containing protein [Candidatus Sigynarchaeota archaeon]